MFVLKDESTGEYMPSSSSQKIDRKDRRWAKVYSTEKAARGAATYYQGLYDHWYETDCVLRERGHKMDNEPRVKSNFVVEPL